MVHSRSLNPIALCLVAILSLVAPASAVEGAKTGSPPTGSRTVSPASAKATRSTTTGVKPRSRRRHARRQPAFTLPQVTRFGIPRLNVKAAYVVDATNNRVLFQKNPERAFPIASLTKMMTLLVFFRTDPQFDRVVEIVPEDVRNSSRSHIRAREEITVRDLLHAAIMSSDNVATKALVRTCGAPRDEFVRRMNALADSLGLPGAHFVEPTGLSELNVATAASCATILRTAASNPAIGAIMQKQTYTFASNRKLHRLVNTNRLLHSKWRITGGKTGFISQAGYCLATLVEAPSGTEVTAVLLGAPSNRMRFAEARRLLDWTFRYGLKPNAVSTEND